jgi:ribosome maturation factor RimP|tara:strand:+ start:839 stop:1306 length:468 start_codon:yes stop_codon:yes gene_type:complete
MNFKEKVGQVLKNSLKEYPELFLISLSISIDNKIKIILDGERGVSINDCITISRSIENNLDAEDPDFAIEVSSVGAEDPFVDKRQYKKNLNRILSIIDKDKNKFKGKLITVDEFEIMIQWKQREPKKIGKGKITKTKSKLLKYSEILEAKVIINF